MQTHQLPYGFRVRQCDETERRISYLIGKSKELKVKVTKPASAAGTRPPLPAPPPRNVTHCSYWRLSATCLRLATLWGTRPPAVQFRRTSHGLACMLFAKVPCLSWIHFRPAASSLVKYPLIKSSTWLC